MEEDERHAEREKKDREQRAHDDKYGGLPRGHARMAQEHDLSNCSAGGPRRE